MINIRKATLNDIQQIHKLGQNVKEFITSDETVTFWPESILRASIDQDMVIILVAETSEAEIVGFVIANCNKPLSKALMENIYVRPDMRQQGIATQMLQMFIGITKQLSYEFVSVLTPPDDIAAINTYQKAGFAKGEVFLWLDLSDSERFRK